MQTYPSSVAVATATAEDGRMYANAANKIICWQYPYMFASFALHKANEAKRSESRNFY